MMTNMYITAFYYFYATCMLINWNVGADPHVCWNVHESELLVKFRRRAGQQAHDGEPR